MIYNNTRKLEMGNVKAGFSTGLLILYIIIEPVLKISFSENLVNTSLLKR